MAPIKVGLQEAPLAPVSDGGGEAMPPTCLETSAPTSLSGEWVPLPEAVAWIIFRDFGKARECRNVSKARLTIDFGMAKAGIDCMFPHMSPTEAEQALLDALRLGQVSALARRSGANDLCDPGIELWAHLRFNEYTNEGWGAESDKIHATFSELLFKSDRLIEYFKAPQPVPEVSINSEQLEEVGGSTSAANSDGGQVVAELSPPSNPHPTRPTSEQIERAYKDRVSNWEGGKPPNETEDWAFLKELSPGLARKRAREIRAKLAPNKWKMRGRPART